ncbi:hypothetical protein K1T71_008742 [Dendrolimus kikuchii]|uniref:Uncharacterized protein n=1 Tax=Dendrolimus kikuchii TaxID=765133 RepID=A0ACC1CVB2_9NEOP|nr:hypothetical protein K1T71_008742 [Dendrolimus kikuchii]
MDTPHASSNYKNQYGPDYGKSWIYFPDGDGVPHIVNLTTPIEQQDNRSYLRNDFNDDDVEFRFYKSGDKENFTILNEFAEAIIEDEKYFMLSNKCVKIITHGWRSTADQPVVELIKNAYLETKNCNVITVDWSSIADSIIYSWVANDVKTVGKKLGLFLDRLYDCYKVTGDKIHLIGHSLGAHVMGAAGNSTKLTIDRITGLDPAKPLFEERELSEKLDYSDARFVDVIHTCGGVLGVWSAIGTADYYPNGGDPPQPGCGSLPRIIACSHRRAYYYYAESIRNPKAFPAYQCENFVDDRCSVNGYMGEDADRRKTGKYYLETNSQSPYSRSTGN